VEKRGVPVLEAPKGRRDEFVEPYFKGAKPDEVVAVLDEVVAVLKARRTGAHHDRDRRQGGQPLASAIC
jgi:hypothetical protein